MRLRVHKEKNMVLKESLFLCLFFIHYVLMDKAKIPKEAPRNTAGCPSIIITYVYYYFTNLTDLTLKLLASVSVHLKRHILLTFVKSAPASPEVALSSTFVKPSDANRKF